MTANLACPICGGPLRPTQVEALDRLVTGEGPFTVEECLACEYGISRPVLDEGALARYYPDEYYEGFYEHSERQRGSLLRRLRERYRRRSAARRFRKSPFGISSPKAGKVLDVGCGSGDLLCRFQQKGWDTHGIDPSRAAVDSAARGGAKVHHGTLRDQPWPAGSFQLITFQHSLEHIVDPIDVLRRARELLADEGAMAIEVPNWTCWQRRWLFRNRWFGLDLPRHRQHYSPAALARTAAQLRLDVSFVGTSSTPISTAYSIHYLIAGRWTPGWKLWLAYALSLPLLPLVLLGDRDCCYIVMSRKGDGPS